MSRPTQGTKWRATPKRVALWIEMSKDFDSSHGNSQVGAVIRTLADDLKAAREELTKLRHAEARGQERVDMLAEEVVKLRPLVAENDAMAALLERTEDYQATDHCDGIDGDEPSEECYDETPCWGHCVAAILAARAKRMGEKATGR